MVTRYSGGAVISGLCNDQRGLSGPMPHGISRLVNNSEFVAVLDATKSVDV
jgi:hypothetical protein